ncbi:MAG: protein kinase [Myxococcales bacterium]|nr:protein kinase [Myxococcales bacterium]
MANRSFAGYVCEESLSVGLFGETFRGRNSRGDEARVVVVESSLALRKNFAVRLAHSAGDVAELMHPNIITTKKVGRGKDGSLVIIASAVDSPSELASIAMRASGRIAQDVALSVAMGALRGLSQAHEHRVVHGGVHPRSVIVDGKGVSKLGDFGLAYALASEAAKTGDSELLAGLHSFVAPELALGEEPDQATDVYAAGALVASLLWGSPEAPAGVSSALAAVVAEAMSTERMRRFSSAIELEAAVRGATAKDNLEVAGTSRVKEYLQGLRGASEARLDAETADLLSSLDLGGGPATTDVPGGLDEALAGLEDESQGRGDRDASAEPKSAAVDPLAGFPDEDEDELTAVDDSYSSVPDAEDALEEMIRSTPHPAAAAAISNAAPRRATQLVADDYEGRDDTPLPVPRPFHQDHTHAVELVELVGRQAAASSPFLDGEELPQGPPRSNSLRWLALIAFVLAPLFAVAYTKTDFLKGAERNNEAWATEALEEIERLQPKPGQITLLSETEDAAVWLLVGRTPAQSFPLPTSMVHELRVEHEGFAPLFLSVGASHWSGEKKARKAELSASLLAATDAASAPTPAFPPIAKPLAVPGGPGQGVIKVESAPDGAEVWLLVGTTPEMTLTGIEAGRDYEFKILRGGFKPAFAAFKTENWYLSGSEGPMRPILSERIALEVVGNETGPKGEDISKGKGGGVESSRSKRRKRSERRRR